MNTMISKVVGPVLQMFGSFGNALDRTPVVGMVHRWTVDRVSNSAEAKELLKKTVYFSMFMITVVVFSAIYFISIGKSTATTSALLGTIFTLFSGIMTIALSAFATALNTTTTTTTNTPSSTPPEAGK